MALRPYSGEYLVSPIPLHLDLNRCSNNCSYCFALNSSRKWESDFKQIMNDVESSKNGKIGKNLTRWLLKEKFPVLISNTTDPFSKSNQNCIEQITDYLNKNNIPISWQTKGGGRSFDVLLKQKPSQVYISITTDREEIRKRHEPNTATFEKRIELAEECLKHGHYVEIGINPFVPMWWNNVKGFIEKMIDKGLKRFVVSQLHFSRQSLPYLNKKRIGESLVKYGLKKNKIDRDYFLSTIWFIEESGGRIDYITDYNINSSEHGFQEYFDKTGNKWFPTIHEWWYKLNKQYIEKGKPIVYSVDDFNRWANAGHGDFKSSQIHSYVESWGRSIRNKGGNTNSYNSFKKVHGLLFDIENYNTVFRSPKTSIVKGEKGLLAFGPKKKIVNSGECNEYKENIWES